MSVMAAAMSGSRADLDQDADKLRSALHEVFTKIDEEYDRQPSHLLLQLSGICCSGLACSHEMMTPRALAAKEARSTWRN